MSNVNSIIDNDLSRELSNNKETDYIINCKKTAKITSRLIIANMASVISSVKKQRKAKKKKLQTVEPEISDISNTLSTSLRFISPTLKTEIGSDITSGNINLVSENPKLCTNKSRNKSFAIDITNEGTQTTSPLLNCIQNVPTPKKNAFELMMTAHKHSIGTNLIGREIEKDPVTVSKDDPTKTKRKLMLEKSADRKGATKRKLEDEASGEYVEYKMMKRANHLKKLLTNSKKKKRYNISETDENSDGDISPFQSNLKNKKKPKHTLKSISTKNKCVTDEGKEKYKKHKSKTDKNMEDEQKPYPVLKSNKNKVKKSENICIDANESKMKINPRVISPNTKENGIVSKYLETDAFVDILSSPIKKRDSLLGYFNKIGKIISPGDEQTLPPITDGNCETGHRRQIESSNNNECMAVILHSTKNRETTPPATNKVTPSQRPKRECRNKISLYNIASEISPVKIAARKSLKRARRLLSNSPGKATSSSKNNCVVQLDTSISSKDNQKLAPIFLKSTPKPILDPKMVKARQQFLMSGIPEIMRLEIEKQRLYEESYECEMVFYPAVSHVNQFVNVAQNHNTSEVCKLKFRYNEESRIDMNLKYKTFKVGIETQRISCNTNVDYKNVQLDNPKKLITQLKENDNTFLYFRCYKQLRNKTKYQTLLSSANKGDSYEGIMFTEKYKPTDLNEIMVNYAPVIELKKFLSSWQENSNKEQYDSSDDFENQSSSHSLFASMTLDKAVVLLGAVGSGKTNAVYALANELNFKVLEINAGSKRTGKKILQMLQEATQSHQVKNNTNDIFDNKKQSKLLKSKSNEDVQKLPLILIEDADIAFEQDFGFVDAIYQLVATTKRPVILVANQENCSHLSRFMNKNAIRFLQPNPSNISKWLSTISVVERRYVSCTDCEKLFIYNDFDLRRTLLELQFFIESGGDRIERKSTLTNQIDDHHINDFKHSEHLPLFNFFTKNQNERSIVPYPVDFDVIKLKKNIPQQNMESKADMSSISVTIDSILDFYNNITTAQRIQSFKNNKSTIVQNLNDAVVYEIVNTAVDHLGEIKYHKKSIHYRSTSKISISSNIESRVLCNRAVNLDMEPCLRSICRNEQNRIKTERSGSRFYHYLRNVITTFTNTSVLDKYCTIFES